MRRIVALLIVVAAVVVGLLATREGPLGFVAPSPTRPAAYLEPEETLRAYFSAWEHGDADTVLALSSVHWRSQFSDDQWRASLEAQRFWGLRLIDVRETEASRSRPEHLRAQQREYHVILEIYPPEGWPPTAWNRGENSRLARLVLEDGGWRLDSLATG